MSHVLAFYAGVILTVLVLAIFRSAPRDGSDGL
jgi:hypothetical protein